MVMTEEDGMELESVPELARLVAALEHDVQCGAPEEEGPGRCEPRCPRRLAARVWAAATAHLDPVTSMPWELRDRFGGRWMWGFDRQCGRWGYKAAGQGHARALAELEADTDPEYGLAPFGRVEWGRTGEPPIMRQVPPPVDMEDAGAVTVVPTPWTDPKDMTITWAKTDETGS